MNKIITTLIFAFITIFVGNAQNSKIVKPFIEVNTDMVEFESVGGTKTLTVSTNIASWKILDMPNWCLAKKTDDSIILTCEPNKSDTKRETVLLINAEEKSLKIQIKQHPKISLTVSPIKIELDNTGGEIKVVVNTNADNWEIYQKTEWCTIEKKEGNILLKCNHNAKYDPRDCEFLITAVDKSVRIKVFQEPTFFLKVSDTVVEFKAAGGYKLISVKTNTPSWNMTGKFFWCTKASSDSLIELCCKTNLDIARSDLFYINAGKFSQKVAVMQRTITSLEKGSWKRALNDVMFNVTISYSNGKYKGEVIKKKVTEGNRTVTSTHRNGLGVYFFEERDSYWGNFKQGDSDGKGIYIIAREGNLNFPNCPDCKYYAGNWASDMKHGIGRCYDKTGELLYYGNFSNDKPTEKYSQKHDETYKFESIEEPNSYKYLGETKNGKKHGLGILFFENGDAWYGEWVNDKRNGPGIDFLFNGSVMTGKWENNIYMGN